MIEDRFSSDPRSFINNVLRTMRCPILYLVYVPIVVNKMRFELRQFDLNLK